MEDFDMEEKQVHTDELGMMTNVKELQEMVHTITITVSQVIDVHQVREAMGEKLYEGLSTMLASAHALVCPKSRRNELLNTLESTIAVLESEDNSAPNTEELPTLSLNEEDSAWLSKLAQDL